MSAAVERVDWRKLYLAEKARGEKLQSLLSEKQEVCRAATERDDDSERDLLATVSHEIRTPLNSIIGFADLLDASELGGQARDYVDMIHTSGEALLLLVNDILDFSKLESGKLALVPCKFDAANLVREVTGVFQPQARTHGIHIGVELDSNAATTAFLDEGRV